MTTVLDVARYILDQRGPMSAMKLQKLVYYSQAWSLVWDEAPLFQEEIEAWTFGPVAPTLYSAHKGKVKVEPVDIGGDPAALNAAQRETVDAVLKAYGDKTAGWLSELTHREAPWRDARAGYEPGSRSVETITHAAMAEYYSGLSKATAKPVDTLPNE